MKNLNIYTFRELIKMYIDERPMPDVAFVTQTEAMKLQSMGKEMNNNSEWITDRMPELEEATNEGDVWVYDVEADEYLIRNYTEIKEGQPWMEIPSPPSYVYVKRKRYKVKSAEDIGLEAPAGYVCVYDILMGDKVTSWLPTREAAERIAAIYEEVMP